MAAGILYVLFAAIAYAVGAERIKKIFPAVVTGPVIVVIGSIYPPPALTTQCPQWKSQVQPPLRGLSILIAMFTLAVIIICTIFAKGFFKLVPILIGLACGYVLCIILDLCGVWVMDYSAITEAHWVNIPYYTEGFFTLPKFDLAVILSIAPIALVTAMEHLGDITTNGAVVGKDFLRIPVFTAPCWGTASPLSLPALSAAPPTPPIQKIPVF